MKIKELLIAAFSFLILNAFFTGCSDKDEKTHADAETTTTDTRQDNASEEEFTETEEDLKNVDYTLFYDKLAPHGEWVEVSIADIKNNSGAGNIAPYKSNFASDLFNIFTNTAIATEKTTDVDVVYVWKPAAAVNTAWQPYSDGKWIYTADNGWYFQANTDPVNLTTHYGRWWNSPSMGWVWVPGKVWSPAWVTWKEDDNNVAWAPASPLTSIVNGVLDIADGDLYDDDDYVLVEKKNLLADNLRDHMILARDEDGDLVLIDDMRVIEGPVLVNGVIVNRGPAVTDIERVIGTPVVVHTINLSNDANPTTVINGTNIIVTKPVLTSSGRRDDDNRTIVIAPKNFLRRDDAVKRKWKLSNDKDFKKWDSDDNDRGFGNDKPGHDDRGKGNDKVRSNDDNSNNRGNDKIKIKEKNNDNSKNKGRGNGKDQIKIKSNDDHSSGKNKNKGNNNRGNDSKGNGNSKGKGKNK